MMHPTMVSEYNGQIIQKKNIQKNLLNRESHSPDAWHGGSSVWVFVTVDAV